MSKPPSVILFDLDDTLFAHRNAVSHGIVAHIENIGGFEGVHQPDAVSLWHALEEKHYHSYLEGTLDFEGQRRARARDFAAAHGVHLEDDASGVWFDDYFEHYIAAWTLHEDALPCLDALEAALPGVRFGIITNGDPAFQRRKLDRVGLTARMGLDEHPERLIASGALGFAKPDPRIFAAACAAFDAEPGRSVYVGDRLHTDAIGAAAAGLTGVWLNRAGEVTPEPSDAAEAAALGVLEIAGLDDLVAALVAL
ncbi:HAD family hydrolase [Microterricola viridarii]|uniref:Putative hydrolase of the HAD superfamily n=1 Tax=Microterricola viridarii TaxID=412690 RepID=A0A1H1QPK6_9MICO|nr:HAD family hydrolase [Microterricola viridarii]SDS25273.1 putative hydrolase of the HAD superfamily [Microterricola viridarii]